MTTVFSLASSLALAVSFSSIAAHAAGAAPASSVNSEVAEICHSTDGRYMAIKGFTDTTTTLVMRNPNPKLKPVVKPGFVCTKDPSGTSEKNLVSSDIFELMAESFGATSKPKAQWKNTYEGRYGGKISVADQTGKSLGIMMMTCNSAIVEY